MADPFSIRPHLFVLTYICFSPSFWSCNNIRSISLTSQQRTQVQKYPSDLTLWVAGAKLFAGSTLFAVFVFSCSKFLSLHSSGFPSLSSTSTTQSICACWWIKGCLPQSQIGIGIRKKSSPSVKEIFSLFLALKRTVLNFVRGSIEECLCEL